LGNANKIKKVREEIWDSAPQGERPQRRKIERPEGNQLEGGNSEQDRKRKHRSREVFGDYAPKCPSRLPKVELFGQGYWEKGYNQREGALREQYGGKKVALGKTERGKLNREDGRGVLSGQAVPDKST